MVRDGPVSVQFSEVQSRAFVVPLRAPYCSARMGVEPQIQRRRTPRPRQKRQGSDHQIKIRSWRKARPKALRGSQRLLKHVKTLEEMLNSSQFVAPLLWGTQPPGAAHQVRPENASCFGPPPKKVNTTPHPSAVGRTTHRSHRGVECEQFRSMGRGAGEGLGSEGVSDRTTPWQSCGVVDPGD